MPESPSYARKPETAVCSLFGMQYQISQSLDEALIPCLISSTVHLLRHLEMYFLLDPVFSVYLVNKMYFSDKKCFTTWWYELEFK